MRGSGSEAMGWQPWILTQGGVGTTGVVTDYHDRSHQHQPLLQTEPNHRSADTGLWKQPHPQRPYKGGARGLSTTLWDNVHDNLQCDSRWCSKRPGGSSRSRVGVDSVSTRAGSSRCLCRVGVGSGSCWGRFRVESGGVELGSGRCRVESGSVSGSKHQLLSTEPMER